MREFCFENVEVRFIEGPPTHTYAFNILYTGINVYVRFILLNVRSGID